MWYVRVFVFLFIFCIAAQFFCVLGQGSMMGPSSLLMPFYNQTYHTTTSVAGMTGYTELKDIPGMIGAIFSMLFWSGYPILNSGFLMYIRNYLLYPVSAAFLLTLFLTLASLITGGGA